MSDNPELKADSFTDFYQSIYGCSPFRWQARLAEQVCSGDWPDFIKLPTSSGKTSCLDIAVFALAFQACRRHATGQVIDAPRRIFFVVDRRIIVNEAFRRASCLAENLKEAIEDPGSPQYAVAWWLRHLAGNQQAPPLDCLELRGGIYRDDAWVRSLLQPTIITSTVDQVGSRLLFRGYGVSDRNLPIHAALTANDSLILLDEAHCSNPFSQTLAAIARYRDAGLAAGEAARWSEQPLHTPFRLVEMTATPRDGDATEVLQLEPADYKADALLQTRHGCSKPTGLVESNARGGRQNLTLARDLVEQAESLATGGDGQPPCLRIAIVVNRVECAREAFELLKKKHGSRCELMIGRMRPIDRDQLTKKLQARFRSGSEAALTEPNFVVATQCLEVGADFDFDGMVCQCANLDALRQRFGRLNRLGNSPHARGVVVMAEGDKSPRKPDPIYGSSLPNTWEWLSQHSSELEIDFGVRSLDAVIAECRAADPSATEQLSVPAVNAPVLMPAHLDLLCQTAPRPALEPEIALYLHGPGRGVPEVRICWRADLPAPADSWEERCHQTLAACPPSSAECLSVPLPVFKLWLKGEDDASVDSGDLLGTENEDSEETERGDKSKSSDLPIHRRGVTWNGKQCHAVSGLSRELNSVYPQSLVVLPATAGGWSTLGYVPDAPDEPRASHDADAELQPLAHRMRDLARIDVATEAFVQARNRPILRVHKALMTSQADHDALDGLWKYVDDENLDWSHEALKFKEDHQSGGPKSESTVSQDMGRSLKLLKVREELSNLGARQAPMVRYPGGFVITGPHISTRDALPRASFDDDFDEHNVDAPARISLSDHLADVAAETRRLVSAINLEAAVAAAVIAAAERHDLGKTDLRFQALLLGSTPDVAAMQPQLWAKSARGFVPTNTHTLPRGFRHEMLSVALAQKVKDELDQDGHDLMLHVIAAHHGHARPFAPVVVDDAPPDVNLGVLSDSKNQKAAILLSCEERRASPAHRLDSGISERFWTLNRRFGWWGLAWLESALRLADWVASAQPIKRISSIHLHAAQDHGAKTTVEQEILLVGIDATNPLAFLAALGVLRTVTAALPDSNVRMAWRSSGKWHPVIVTNCELTRDDLTSLIHEALHGRQNDSHFIDLGKNINVHHSEFRRAVMNSVAAAHMHNRVSADFYSAYGSEALVSPNDLTTIQDTALRTMAGAGHQHFLETMRNLIEACGIGHIEKTLFHPWDYSDPSQTLSLRYDPSDDNRYALRWRNPSGDPARKSSGSMLGANRLAIEALPLFVTAPGASRLQTAGFTGHRSNDTYIHWPLWESLLPLSVVQSLLVLPQVIGGPTSAQQLFDRGVGGVMTSQRITVGKVRNFSQGSPCWSTTSIDRS